MPKCITKTRKVGGSLVVTLPKEIVTIQKIKENQFVEIIVRKCRKDGFGTFKGMASFSKEDELKSFE